ncbi:uncharacterized protein LOC124371831 [Homalodisca vitripennis]|uniref:uncharacterized protein LOC124371831 n=1 Tax=Homalodisca vitripennis TaxID=197043 RepID=UPI001EE9B750|nr:uncharacterized protein LOC124371831 [Homalodisca vitripennis]
MFVDTGDADITVVNCFGRSENTAIEFDTEPKTEARMRWMPDFDYAGNITFLATIVQSGEIFWLREKGDSISVYTTRGRTLHIVSACFYIFFTVSRTVLLFHTPMK